MLNNKIVTQIKNCCRNETQRLKQNKLDKIFALHSNITILRIKVVLSPKRPNPKNKLKHSWKAECEDRVTNEGLGNRTSDVMISVMGDG